MSMPSNKEAQVSSRYPIDLLRAFDALFPLAGYATRQEALREVMRRFVEEWGVKQSVIIKDAIKLRGRKNKRAG
jgi:metal-responsive CopG/Arc/MetJ family transcriptional regulator